MNDALRFIPLSIIACFLFSITGCKKDDKDPDITTLLTKHVWKIWELSTTSTDPDIQLAVTYKSSQMTNAELQFRMDGYYFIVIHQQSDMGTWELNANETAIIVDKGTIHETEWEILQLTKSQLELKEYVDDKTLGTFDITYNWVVI